MMAQLQPGSRPLLARQRAAIDVHGLAGTGVFQQHGKQQQRTRRGYPCLAQSRLGGQEDARRGPSYQQQPMPQQTATTGPAPMDPQALARRPMGLQPPSQPQQPVAIEMTQVVGKQVITRTTGRNLGVISGMWVDPVRYELVSLDLDDKKGVGSTRVCNFPLSRLTQIGDVVLVHDEAVLYDQPLDGRYGYYILTGMEVRTRSGEFLGKVRDFSFSPDNGAISRVVYDDFGLSFLPVSFFDTYSLPMADVVSMGVGGLVVSEEARYRERRESPGLFAAIPSLLRSLSNTGGNRMAGGLTDGYRQDGSVAGYLPQGYSYSQWEQDVRRWEQETGMTYDQYTRMAGQQQQQQPPQQMGMRGRQAALPAPRGPAPGMQQAPAPGVQQQQGFGARPMQAPQQGYGAQQPQYGTQQPQYGFGNAPPQQQQGYAPPAQMMPQQQQQAAPRRGAPPDPRYRNPGVAAAPGPQQQPGVGAPRGPGAPSQPLPQQPQQQQAPPPAQYGMPPNQQPQQWPVQPLRQPVQTEGGSQAGPGGPQQGSGPQAGKAQPAPGGTAQQSAPSTPPAAVPMDQWLVRGEPKGEPVPVDSGWAANKGGNTGARQMGQ
mmetsp:Transcript_5540/g.9626  ORF Transcript_5540/g.9626 Transcript_5540/m.9626 type:complete len:599 (-) Transcript_5540:1232-3028(-)